MALRLSDAIRDALLSGVTLKDALSNASIDLYSGAQPATANAAPTGTLLCTYTLAGGAKTNEVLSVGSITLTGGASGSVNTLTVNSIEVMGAVVPFNASLNQTATDVATQINRNPANKMYTASTTGASAVITITGRPGTGALVNGQVVAGTGTTITLGSPVNLAGGVTAVNGLSWDIATLASIGSISKLPAQVWQGTAVAAGTAGWFRIRAAVTDPGTLDSAAVVTRVDGAVATSGAELNMASTAISNGAVQTLSSFSISLPTA